VVRTLVLRHEHERRLAIVQVLRPDDRLAVVTLEADGHLAQHLEHHHLLHAVGDDVLALVAVVVDSLLVVAVMEPERVKP